MRCLVKADDDAFGRGGVEALEAAEQRPIATELRSGRGLAGLSGPEIVFHLAANTHTWEPDQRCNDVGTENLFRAVEPLGPEQHFIFVSTEAVLDNRASLGEPLRVDSPTIGPPLSRYGLTKWQAEGFLKARCRERGFRLTILRLCTVYGPRPRPNSFFDVLKREVARRSIVSRLNWPGLTSFIHVDDAVTCLLKTAKQPPPPGAPRVCLLATESQTLQNVSEMLYRAAGVPYRMIRLPPVFWRPLKQAHAACRLAHGLLPVAWYNFLWRFNLVVNPVFHCDPTALTRLFPDLNPRRMVDCIGEI